jgi:AraC-like DNA-binding protein
MRGKKWLFIAAFVVAAMIIAAGVAVAANGPGSLVQDIHALSPISLAQDMLGRHQGAAGQNQVFLTNLASALGISSSTLDSELATAETQAVTQALQKGRISQARAAQFESQIGTGRPLFGMIDPRQLATALGVKPAVLESALETAAGQTVNQELQNGTITSQQAARLNSQIAEGMPVFGFEGLHAQGGGAVNGFMLVEPLAKVLKMSPLDVINALRSGQSVASLVAGKGTTVEAAQSAMLSLIDSQINNSAVGSQTANARRYQLYEELQQSINSGDWVAQLQQLHLLGMPKTVKRPSTGSVPKGSPAGTKTTQ